MARVGRHLIVTERPEAMGEPFFAGAGGTPLCSRGFSLIDDDELRQLRQLRQLQGASRRSSAMSVPG